MHRTTRVILSALLGSLLLSPALSSAAILACPLTLDQADDRQLQDLRRQADEGDACAQFNMGYLSYTQQDYVQSERWYTEAAEQGVARAAFEIAILYRDELLADPGPEQQRWLVRAAEQGLALAQAELGILYLSRSDDPDARIQAMRWFEQAALQGDVQSMYLLGELYWSDDAGVQFQAEGDELAAHFASDDSKALHWICQAASSNHAPAQLSMSDAYSTGRGTRSNQIQRQLWLELAAANGSEEAKERLSQDDSAWYTQLEKWTQRQLSDDSAHCPPSGPGTQTDEEFTP